MNMNAFDAIIGYEDIKLELFRILDQLVDPEKYGAFGVTQPHGLLLHGAPGVGKSTIAQSLLEASGRNVYICRKDKPNGDFVKEICRVFEEAQENAPSMILLDDLDKFSKEDERHRDAEEFVTVQSCIDMVKDKQVFVVATANSIRKLPDSLIRAGRFDHILTIRCPKGEDAERIIAHYLAKKPFVGNVNVRRIAHILEGRSCAELESVVNQAGMYSAFAGKEQVDMADMLKAILRVIFEAPEKSKADESCLPLVACHEAGHTLISELLEPDSVDLVTVLNHDSQAAGITSLHMRADYFHSKQRMENRVMCLLAGKAATEICYGTVDPGTISDLRRAFDIVHRFVDDYCSYGFDKYVYTQDVSDDMKAKRDAQVAMEMDRYYARTRQMLIENRVKLEAITARLLEEKTLLGEQVQEILKSA